MDRGVWQAEVPGTARVGHHLATKSPTTTTYTQVFPNFCPSPETWAPGYPAPSLHPFPHHFPFTDIPFSYLDLFNPLLIFSTASSLLQSTWLHAMNLRHPGSTDAEEQSSTRLADRLQWSDLADLSQSSLRPWTQVSAPVRTLWLNSHSFFCLPWDFQEMKPTTPKSQCH